MCERRRLQSPVREVLFQKQGGLKWEGFDVPGFISFWILPKRRGEAEKAEGELAWTAGTGSATMEECCSGTEIARSKRRGQAFRGRVHA